MRCNGVLEGNLRCVWCDFQSIRELKNDLRVLVQCVAILARAAMGDVTHVT